MICVQLPEMRKEKRNEKNVSAFEDQTRAQMRIPRQNGDPRRTPGSLPSPSERPQETRSLTGMTPARTDNTLPGEAPGNSGNPPDADSGLKLKSEFDAVKKNGKRVVARYFIALVSNGEFGISRKCGVICSRKFDKRAVRRNRARRLVKESFRLLREELGPCGIIIIPKREILRVKMQDVKAELAKALIKTGTMNRT